MSGFGARSILAGLPFGDSIPFALLPLMCFLCFICHNSKGKANSAIILIDFSHGPIAALRSTCAGWGAAILAFFSGLGYVRAIHRLTARDLRRNASKMAENTLNLECC